MTDNKAFFDTVRMPLFKNKMTQPQVDGINGIFKAWESVGNGNSKHLAYVFATVYHETGKLMVPVREGFAKDDAAARRMVAGRRYGKPVTPYNHVYYGRGQIQLTWAENYKACSGCAGVDLFRHPDKALDPVIGARIAISGILDGRFNGRGHGIGHYLTPAGDDLKNARRTVNITDKWDLIAGYYQIFLDALGGPTEAPKPTVEPEWLEMATALAAWRAAAPEGAIEWLQEIPE